MRALRILRTTSVAALLLVLAGVGSAQIVYYEQPTLYAPADRHYPQLVQTDVATHLFVQSTVTSGDRRIVQVEVSTTSDGRSWSNPVTLPSRFELVDPAVPRLYGAAGLPGGGVVVAVLGIDAILVYRSDVGGSSFTEVAQIPVAQTTSNPRVFVMAGGAPMVVAEERVDGVNRIVASRSQGDVFTDLEVLVTDDPDSVSDAEELNQWNPAHAVIDNKDIIVFERQIAVVPTQSDQTVAVPTYQLFLSASEDGGLTWSSARWVTQIDQTSDAITHNNRRPEVVSVDDGAVLVWERGSRQLNRQVYYAHLSASGVLTDTENISGNELDNEEAVYFPRYLVSGDTEYILAFNNPNRASRIVLFERSGGPWQESELTRVGASRYGTFAAIDGKLHIFWETRDGTSNDLPSRIVYRGPDQSAQPPDVIAVNFTPGTRSARDEATFRWSAPPDASGVVAYSYEWSQDPEAEPDFQIDLQPDRLSAEETVALTADEDGEWYFSVRSLDRAGNWSEPTSVVFFRDTTPPPAVVFDRPGLDEDGFLVSNTFSLSWHPGNDDPISGYGYELFRAGDPEAELDPADITVPGIGGRIDTRENFIGRSNIDNGLWGLAVSAVDSVGNIGPASVLLFRTNKYIPVTEISWIAQSVDALGRYALEIYGRGFTTPDDTVSFVYIDDDGYAPYDYTFSRLDGDFTVVSDRLIEGLLVDDIETGQYVVGVYHPERGPEFSGQVLSFEQNGTIKYGNYVVRRGVNFTTVAEPKPLWDSISAVVWVTLGLVGLIVLFSVTRLVAIGREARIVRLEVRALLAGGGRALPGSVREARLREMRKRGIGLRAKFAAFVTVLVATIVASLALGLSVVTLANQRESLARSLYDRTAILIQGMAADGEVLLRTRNVVEAENRVARIDALPGEAYYATITGGPPWPTDWAIPAQVAEYERLFDVNYVLATNDPVVDPNVQAPEVPEGEVVEGSVLDAATRVPFGRSVSMVESSVDGYTALPGSPVTELELLRDGLSGPAQAVIDRLNELARADLGDLERLIWEAEQAYREAVVLTPEDTDDEDAVYDLQSSLVARRAEFLQQIAGAAKVYPEFSVSEFDLSESDYIFWYPIMTPDPTIDNAAQFTAPTADNPVGERIELNDDELARARYVQGIIRVGVSTDVIGRQIANARRDIVLITLVIAALAIAVGVVGAIGLATLVVRPIRRLVAAVEQIRDTTDKSQLKDERYRIKVRSRDELARLANTVNTMTEGLAEAAEAAKDLTVSSDLQKAFMPLDAVGSDEHRRKLTSSHDETDKVEFHGYYEGADALSGDYFTYERLDVNNYALIKCDVSGHGVEAAIIMVEVASIFLNHVRDWRSKRKSRRLDELLVAMNTLVEERRFYKKFAAMTVGILNVDNGRFHVSNAGDNILRTYRVAAGDVEKNNLKRPPAAGMFSIDDFPPGVEYKEEYQDILPGDLLLLPTDGIEESKRFLRDAQYEPILFSHDAYDRFCAEQGWEDERDAMGHGFYRESPGAEQSRVSEEFTYGRFDEIVRQVQRRGKYTLSRFQDPNPDEELVFDYTKLEPTAENTVLSVMAAEKVFRLMRDPAAGEQDLVRVDAKIDGFLRDHFSLYNLYFGHPVPLEQTEMPDRDEYVWFSHLREESQGDDLTMLAIRRK